MSLYHLETNGRSPRLSNFYFNDRSNSMEPVLVLASSWSFWFCSDELQTSILHSDQSDKIGGLVGQQSTPSRSMITL